DRDEVLRRAEEGNRQSPRQGDGEEEVLGLRRIGADVRRVDGGRANDRVERLRVRGVHVHLALPPDRERALLRVARLWIDQRRPEVVAHSTPEPELFE